MRKQSSRFAYTEEEMADRFQELLGSPEGLPGLGPFDAVHREVLCRQGQPDFIALRMRGAAPAIGAMAHVGLVGSSLLSLLKPAAPRTLDYLIRESGFSANSVRRSLVAMEACGLAQETPTGSYTLGDSASGLDAEIWAFELKLNDTRRAVFQAQQARAYAERVFIVAPPGRVQRFARFQKTMARWGIGLASYDPLVGLFAVSSRARKRRSLSLQHRLYVISRVACGLV